MAGFLDKILKESQGNGSMWTNLFRIAQSYEIHYPMELSWVLLACGDTIDSHLSCESPRARLRQAGTARGLQGTLRSRKWNRLLFSSLVTWKVGWESISRRG